MGQKDIISKRLIQRIAVDLAVYLLGFDIEFDDLELIPSEKQRVEERRADLVAKVQQKDESFILHIEIQNNNDSLMPLRMLRYYTDIAFATPDLPIRQHVIYIGKAALSMPSHKKDNDLNYHYHIINMHTIDYQKLLLQDSPDAIVLAILCDFNADSESSAVKRIVSQLHDKLHNHPKQFRDYMYMLEVLSDNRNLKTFIKEAETMITNVNIENLPSYELGMEKGIEAGIEQGIKKGTEAGIETGIEKGLEQGIEKGIKKGMTKGIHMIVKQLLVKNTPEAVAEMTNLSLGDIMDIKNTNTH